MLEEDANADHPTQAGSSQEESTSDFWWGVRVSKPISHQPVFAAPHQLTEFIDIWPGQPMPKGKKGLGVNELVKLTFFTEFSDGEVCKEVPSPASDSVFIIDLWCVHSKDLSSDDSDSYGKGASSPSAIVSATFLNCKI